jgi:hypothetical protein
LNEADERAALLRAVLDRRGPVVPDSASWGRWEWLARRERVIPLLYSIVDTQPTDLTDEQRDEIRGRMGTAMSRCVQLEHHLVVVVRLLGEIGVRSAVLKGGATAHLDYPDPSWREVGDVDLLIDPTDRVRATELLTRRGWTQGYPLPRGHEHSTHAVTFVRDGMELDLHQRVAHRALGLLIPTRELLDRTVSFEVAGSTMHALDEIDRLVHSAVHAVTSRGPNRRLSSVADVLLAAHRRAHTAPEVLARAERWRVRAIVERGVRDAYAVAQLDLDGTWAEAMRRPITRRDRLVDRAYLAPVRRPVIEELAYLRLLEGVRDRGRYVLGHLTPVHEEAAGPARSALERAKYVVSKLRSRS